MTLARLSERPNLTAAGLLPRSPRRVAACYLGKAGTGADRDGGELAYARVQQLPVDQDKEQL